jgi:adenylylsulfate kinase
LWALRRDTKGLYYRAFLPDHHEQKIHHLSGVNDPFEPPQDVDLIIDTNESTAEASTDKLLNFILSNIKHIS